MGGELTSVTKRSAIMHLTDPPVGIGRNFSLLRVQIIENPSGISARQARPIINSSCCNKANLCPFSLITVGID